VGWRDLQAQRLLQPPELGAMIANTQRAYISSHPLALRFSLGLFIVGLVSLVAPQTIEQTATSMALPEWLQIGFRLTWTLGGAASVWGIIRGRRAFEAAGMTLIATGLAIDYLAIVSVRWQSALPGLFILFLAEGCFQRTRHLRKNGYEIVEVRGSR
jgi:hypothetical protein